MGPEERWDWEEGEGEKKRLGRKRSRKKGLREKGGVSGAKAALKREGEEMPKREK